MPCKPGVALGDEGPIPGLREVFAETEIPGDVIHQRRMTSGVVAATVGVTIVAAAVAPCAAP